ncbi:hypothetical protein Q1695_000618 [Nippostrongylus brasiliensis]|nr:hypothetical protein Q1695_000618 [Nippostrongylus brasiliensis]
MLLILAYIGVTTARIPRSLLVPNRSYPPQQPVNVRFKIDVQQTQMDFTSATLYVHGTTTLSWTDPRKSWLPAESGENTFNIDAALTPGNFRQVYAGLWIPSIKNRFKLLTFRSSSNLYSDRLFFTSTGGVLHEFRFMLMIACLVEDINYPYDIYLCYEKFGNYERNTTVRYTYATSSKEFMTISESAYRSGHKITGYTSYKNVTDMGNIDSNLKNFYPETIDIGFTVQRHQPRVIINLLVPIYCITFMDGFIYVFGYGMQRAYLLPVYATYFSDISTIYTIARLPHIARWFFARLFSSSVCLVALIFTKDHLADCSRRFMAIVASTVIFYAIFSFPIDMFRSS